MFSALRLNRYRLSALSLIAGALTLAACNVPPASTLPLAPETASGYRSDLQTRHASKHMAAAANPLAAEAGRAMLRQGGSAIDAAIAMQAVLTLVEPQSSGIGGGALIVLWDGKTVRTYDGRETAPAGATEKLFLQADGKPMPFTQAQIGGRSVGTPACCGPWNWPIRNTGACHGRSCSSRRSDSRSKVSPSRHACIS